MNTKSGLLRVCYILLGMFILLMIGCKTDDASGPEWENLAKTRHNIAKEIDDPQRAEQLLILIDTHEKQVTTIKEEVKLIRQELEIKNRDFTTSRDEMQTLYDQLSAKLDLVLAAIRDDSMEMKQLCSEEEWEAIFAHRKQRFKLFN